MELKSGQDILGLGELLDGKEKEYHGKDDMFGMTLMGFPQYTSGTRLTMFTNHLKQFNTLNKGEFPRIFTNYENIFGKNSSSLVTAKDDYEVVAKIDKFEDYPNYLYALFVYSKKEDKYDVIFKKISEDLTEKFGYKYNNEHLDTLEVGDKISKGEVLYKSSSYDEDNNYCYGLNARCAYILDPGNIEDAYVVSESFAKRMVSRKVDTIDISINDNDFLLNIYGSAKHYKAFPDIGEDIKHCIVTAKRRIINDQSLYDMKKANMARIEPMSDKIHYGKGFVTDIDIYSNKSIDEIPDKQYNEQIIHYLKNQNRYYTEIKEQCQKIIDSGSKYSDDIGFVYARAKNIMDPNYKWKDSETVFSNMILSIRVDRDVMLFPGSKITGRFGDKGVISEIRPDKYMPFTEDGRVVDLITNPQSCPNRLNPFQFFENGFNHCSAYIIMQLKAMKTHAERFAHLSKYLKYFNERGELDQLTEYYNGLTKSEKDEFWESVYNDGIYINYPPMWDDMPALEKLHEIYKEFNIPRDQLYVRMKIDDKHERIVPIMRKIIVGEKFMIKLKQTSEKNFSARSTGSLSQKGVPEKSNKVRSNEMLYSQTPVAVGRDENNNLGIGVAPFMLAKFHLVYRSSPFARRQVGKMYTNNVLNFKKFKVKKNYYNRNAEILNAKLKSLGARIDFGFNGIRPVIEDESIHLFQFKDEVYLCTKEQMRERLLERLMRRSFNKLKLKGTKKELEKKYQKFKKEELQRAQGYLIVQLGEQEEV